MPRALAATPFNSFAFGSDGHRGEPNSQPSVGHRAGRAARSEGEVELSDRAAVREQTPFQTVPADQGVGILALVPPVRHDHRQRIGE